jgi:hypothetical protein
VLPRDDYFAALFGSDHPLPRYLLLTARDSELFSREFELSLEEHEWDDVSDRLQVMLYCSCDV